MSVFHSRISRAGLVVALFAGAAGCAVKGVLRDPHAGHQMPASGPAATSDMLPGDPPARPELVRFPYTKADVDFMQGMIPHHAQALVMCAMAKPNGASEQLQKMCERMTVSQRDEIFMMRTWLRDRGQTVPRPDATHHAMDHGGMKHDMLMPGMLTDAEMAELKAARGRDWDRLFLKGMIKHHQGAIDMVEVLLATDGSLQDEELFQYASDVQADQSAEIERMEQMLAALGGGLHQ